MPGLVGFINGEKNIHDSSLMSDMCNILKHRKRYRAENYSDVRRGLAISHIHLGILDDAPQPFTSQDNKVKILMHGEIYNDEATDRSQLEFIYEQYQKYGADFALNLNGSFVIAIIDEVKDTVVITSDRTASKPFFYFIDSPTIYFAPEIKALLLIPSLTKTLNQAAIANFLACGSFINGEMLIEGIKVLDNASVMEITSTGISLHKYWQLAYAEEPEDKGVEYYQDILSGLLRKAIHRYIRTKHEYGILLSGGYDSRGLLGYYIDEKGNQDVNTISWGAKEDTPQSDCAIAKKVANELGIKHRFYELKAHEIIHNLYDFIFLSDGLTDAFTNYPESLKIFQKIRDEEGIQIIIRGDEVFGGYISWDDVSLFHIMNIRSLSDMPRYKKILKEPYFNSFSELNSRTLKAISAKYQATNIQNRVDFFYLDQRIKYYHGYLNYFKSMGVELRNPFLDNDIMDFTSTIPPKYRLHKNLYIKTIVSVFPYIFKEVAKRDNAINLTKESRNSPELRDFIYEELVEKKNEIDEYINIDGLKNELDTFFYGKDYSSIRSKLKMIMIPKLEKIPAFYPFIRKLSTKSISGITMKDIISRLLTLKIWCDIFMKPEKW